MRKTTAMGIAAITLMVTMVPLNANAAVFGSNNKYFNSRSVVTVRSNGNFDDLLSRLKSYGVSQSCLNWFKNISKEKSNDQYLADCTYASTEGQTEAPTEATTVATTVAPTEATTVATTAAPTEATTVATTAAPTQATTAAQTTVQTSAQEQNNLSYAHQVVNLVNVERAKEGLAPLKIDTELEKAALVRTREIQTKFDHTRPNGSSFFTAIKEQGINYRGAGENIAWGQRTPEAVVDAWMNSPGHRANIMNKSFVNIGVGNIQNSAGTQYWVQLFTY